MQYDYKEASLKTRNAIRLLELFPGAPDDPIIHIEIYRTNLQAAKSTFEALSYTWGNEKLRKTIYCCPNRTQQLNISLNCYTALRYLRHERDKRTLWIDAICINQSDAIERSAQVRMMGDTFASASLVVVFLGESNAGSDSLFRHLKAADDWIDSGKYVKALPPPHKFIVDELGNLLDRPWFSRIWVVQEIFNASKFIFMCGHNTATYEAVRSCLFGHSANRRVTQRMPIPLELVRSYLRKECSTAFQEMFMLVIETSLCNASDPRDRILALIPLIKPKEPALDKLVDYSKSAEEVFKAFSLLLVQEIGLLALSLVRHPHSRNMPSWMPDWSLQIKQLSILQYFGASMFLLYKKSEIRQHFTINIGTGVDCPNLPLLTVTGKRYGSVGQVGPVVEFQIGKWSDREVLVKALLDDLKSIRTGTILSHWPASIIQALQETEDDDISLILCRTMARKECEFIVNSDQLEEEIIADIIGNTANCIIFVTEDGRLGVASREAQAGDVVCLIKGSMQPCILRKDRAGRWRLVCGDYFLLDIYKDMLERNYDEAVCYAEMEHIEDLVCEQASQETFCLLNPRNQIATTLALGYASYTIQI